MGKLQLCGSEFPTGIGTVPQLIVIGPPDSILHVAFHIMFRALTRRLDGDHTVRRV